MRNRTIYKEFCESWLTDGIDEDYKQWLTNRDITNQARREGRLSIVDTSHIFIESPTGTGKTSLILDRLLPHAKENCRNILYISNRSALLQQVENELRKRHGESLIEDVIPTNTPTFYYNYLFFNPQPKPDKPEPSFKSFNLGKDSFHIALSNYQSLFNFFQNIPPNNFYYVIFDEIHYFLEDSMFNAQTTQTFLNIVEATKESVCIMLSATMQDVFELFEQSIYEVSTEIMAQRTRNSIPTSLFNPNVIFYKNTFQRSAYKPIFYNDYDVIIDRIYKSRPEDKWLIFVTAKTQGEKLLKQIRENKNCSATFVNSQKKNSAVWKKLVEESIFKSKVLITTTVLDNGVNINDPNLKNIVLPFCDKTEFIQMLGRKRLQPDEKVKIYIQIPDLKVLRSKLKNIKNLFNAIAPFVNNTLSPSHMTKMLQRYWRNANSNINRMFYINQNRDLILNYFAYLKITHLGVFYSDLIKNNHKPHYYQDIIYDWLNMPQNSKRYIATSSKSGSLTGLLNNFLNKPISIENQESFYQDFQFLYKNKCKKTFWDNKDMYDKALSIKKDKTQRKATMNRELAMLNLPYKFIKSKKCWVLTKILPQTNEQA